ncbi:MAG: signal peptidase I [Bacteroidetes bacterium]|nr:MAG: signal peptidase I [Bacteroidota bacterium]
MKRRWLRYLAFLACGAGIAVLSIWTELWVLLPLILILFDLFITRRVDWSLRSYGLPPRLLSAMEWTSVVLLAILLSISVKVLFLEAYKIPTPSMEESLMTGDYIFVSKLAYGPRLPSTPLSLPFFHNKTPSGRKSYSERFKLPYKRLKGYSRVKRGDIIVFNFPEGDSMVIQYPGQNYYSLIRQYGRDYILGEFDILTHPVDKRENYVKRCIALPGDTLLISEGKVVVNNEIRKEAPGQLFKYYVSTQDAPLPDELLDSLKILKSTVSYNPLNNLHVLYLASHHIDFLKDHDAVRSIKRYVEPMLSFQNKEIFPHDPRFRWNGDHFGPLYVPAKGASIHLSVANLPLYKRIIEVYEGNKLEVDGEKIMINDSLANSYTFKMDYYFVMGDNHHNSADSRYWGFVPEDHLLGKARMVWFSVDPKRGLLDGFRKERIFETVK